MSSFTGLYSHLQRCTVRIRVASSQSGTGFFIAPGRVLTCSHVVTPKSGSGPAAAIEVDTHFGTLRGDVEIFLPSTDLAVVTVAAAIGGQEHSCVLIDPSVEPYDNLYSFGFPGNYKSRRGEPATYELEGERSVELGKDRQYFLKFKAGQALPGASGSPLLNRRTRAVCGMLKSTRDPQTDLGGFGIPGRVILESIRELSSWQRGYHEKHRDWFEAVHETRGEDRVETLRVVRETTANDCCKIKFLSGEGGMDQGSWRQITVRGRRPDDQTQIAQAIESLLNETLQERVGRLPTGAGLKKRGAESDHGESWPVTSLEERIKEKCAYDVNGRPRALLLTDEPGGGKSTTARNIAWRIARQVTPFEDETRLPVYVRLRDWEVSECSGHALATYLGEHHARDSRPPSWPQRDFWEKALGEERGPEGRLFLVLDGLDEVRSSRTFAFDLLDEVQALARRGNVVLLTCRTRSLAAYKSKLTGFDILRLDGLSSEETELFVKQYPGLTNPVRLLDELQQEPAMVQLVREPFLLDAVCYLAAKGEGALPECRSELLDKAIDQLLLDVDLADFSWPDDNPPTNSELRSVLAKACLTLRIQEEDGQTYNLFSFSKFEHAVQAALEPPQSGLGRVLSRFFSRTRLLQLPLEQQLSRENFGSFSHSLFLDFLAAEGLKGSIEFTKPGHDAWQSKIASFSNEVDVSEFVALKAHDPAWFELFSFLPSRLREPKRFFEVLAESPDDLSRRSATLAIRALGELRTTTLTHPDNRLWVEHVAQSCWDIAAVHWQLGVTRLVEPLVAEISSVARVYPRLVERLARDLKSTQLQTRLEALAGVDRIGPAAASVAGVIDGLIFNLRDRNWSVRKIASTTAAKMGRFAVPATLQLLNKLQTPALAPPPATGDPDLQRPDAWYEQASACEAVGQMGALTLGEKIGEAVESLLRLTVHDQPLIRANACEALGSLAPHLPGLEEVVRRLTERASEVAENPTVKAQASGALGKCGGVAAQSPAALDALIMCIAHEDWVVRTSAGKALAELSRLTGVDGRRIVSALAEHARSGNSATRSSVCETLSELRGVFKGYPEDFKQILAAQIADKDVTVCKHASKAAASLQIKIADAAVVARLLDALIDPDWHTRASAVEAIGNIKESVAEYAEQVLDRLIKNLRDSKWFVRASSSEALGRLAPVLASAGPQVIQELMGVLNPVDPELIDGDGHVVAKVLRALPKFGLTTARSTGVLQRMAEFLASEHWQVQLAACDAFEEIGPEAAEVRGVLDGLSACLKSKMWCVRAHGCKALGVLMAVGDSKRGIAELLDCFCDDQQPVRVEAAEIFSRLAGEDLGFHFFLDAGQRRLLTTRLDKLVVGVPFPKPTPIVFLHSLSVADTAQARQERHYGG